MATSSFTRKIVLGEEAADRILEILATEDKPITSEVPEYTLDDEEFIQKCLGLTPRKK